MATLGSFVGGLGSGGSAVGSAVVRLFLDASQYEAGLAKAKGSTTAAASGMSAGVKAASTAFIALGAAAVIGIDKGIKATLELASETRGLQLATGLTAEAASGLIAVGADLGVGVDKLSIGFGQLSKSIVNVAPNLTKYGIVTKDAAGNTLPFDTVLANVIDKFQTIPDSGDRAAFAMNVFGKSGRALLPILAKGNEGIAELTAKAEEMGLIMSQSDVDAAKQLTIAQRELGEAFKGASISLGESFIPAITVLVNSLTEVVSLVSKIPQPIITIGLTFAVLSGVIAAATRAAVFFKGVWGPIIGWLTAATAAEEELGVAYVQTTLEIEAQEAALAAAGVAWTAIAGPIAVVIGLFTAAYLVSNHLNGAISDAIQPAVGLAQAAQLATQKHIPFAEALAQVQQAAGDLGVQAGTTSAAVTALAATFGAGSNDLQHLSDITGETSDQFRATFTQGLDDAQKFADDNGLAFDSVAAKAEAFGAASKEAMDKARAAFDSFQSSATDSLMGFTTDALSTLADKTHLTVGTVISSFDKAAAATKQFGRDVLEISRTGGKAGDALAQQLLAMGPSAAGLAAFIADASGKAKRDMIDAFGGGADAAESAATKITKSILGTMRDVRHILAQIARHWDIDLGTKGAKKTNDDVTTIHDNLLDLAGPFLTPVGIIDNTSPRLNAITNQLGTVESKLSALNNKEINIAVITHYSHTGKID